MRRESDTLQRGATAPDFILADPRGARYGLADLLSGADVGTQQAATTRRLLLVFDRGTW